MLMTAERIVNAVVGKHLLKLVTIIDNKALKKIFVQIVHSRNVPVCDEDGSFIAVGSFFGAGNYPFDKKGLKYLVLSGDLTALTMRSAVISMSRQA